MIRIFLITIALLLLGPNAYAIIPAKYLGDKLPLDATIASYNKLIKSNRYLGNDLARIHWERAKQFTALRRFDAADHDLSSAIDINPTYINAYLLRASVRATLQKYRLAYQDYNKVLEISPNNLNVFKYRGTLNFVLGKFAAAANDYRHYLKLKPHDLYRVLWLYLSEKYNNRKANSSVRQYLSGLNLDVWPGAMVKLYLGDITFDELQNAFKTNDLNLDTGHACEAYYYLGQYFLLNGDRASAKIFFTKAIKTRAKDYIEYKFSLAFLEKL